MSTSCNSDKMIDRGTNVHNHGHVPLDQLDPRPYSEQLAAIIREQIRTGALKPRSLVPSESALQAEHLISRGTVRAAMRLLREEGWVVTIQGRGTFVAPRDRWPENNEPDA